MVRKRELNEEEREEMPTWEYLAPTPSDGQYGDVLECDLATLPIKPIETGAKRAFNQEANHGTVVKLIEYQYKSSCSTGNLLLRSGMRAALDTCFPEPPLPYRIFDERYEAHTPADTTQGLIYRLEKDKQESIEEGFPSTYDMTILNENAVSAKVYVFKSGKPKHVQRYNRDTYINKAGVIFTVNGQTHHTIDTGFFSTRGIKYGHIKDTMAVIVDCSKLSRKTLSDLFTSSRDQIRKNDFYIALIDQLAESIKNDRLLRDVNMRRGQENLRRDLDSSKTIDDILKDLLKKNKSLAEFLKLGGRAPRTISSKGSEEEEITQPSIAKILQPSLG